MICPNICRVSFLLALSIIRGREAPIMPKEKRLDIPVHGCIIKDVISIIMNTGSITAAGMAV